MGFNKAQETKISGGFTFKDVALNKISSIEYGTRVSLSVIALGVILILSGIGLLIASGMSEPLILSVIGLGLIAYAYWRRRQVLRIQASGGVSIALAFSKGEQVDDIMRYLHAERMKQSG